MLIRRPRRAGRAPDRGDESGPTFFAGLFLVSISFAAVIAISLLAALLMGASAGRAAVVGGVCGFAAAFVLDAIIVIGRRTEAERRRQFDGGDAG
jgi:uncharacterized membrane protein (DUF485 family)